MVLKEESVTSLDRFEKTPDDRGDGAGLTIYYIAADVYYTECAQACNGNTLLCQGNSSTCDASCRYPPLTGVSCTPFNTTYSNGQCVSGTCRTTVSSSCSSVVPTPLMEWNFTSGSYQDVGQVTNSYLASGASISNGRLVLDGTG